VQNKQATKPFIHERGDAMAGYFELKMGKSGKYSFNLKSGNHQVILTSETYESKAAVVAGIASVQKNSSSDAKFDRRTAKNGEPYFVLKAGNGEIIGKSEMYSSKSSMERGIASVEKNGGSKTIKERE